MEVDAFRVQAIEEVCILMRCVVELSEVEKLTLEQLSLNHRHRDIRTRAAGVVMLSNGLSAPKVAQRLGMSVQSPYNWVRGWNELGLCGLLSGHSGGRPRALSQAQITTAVQAACAESLTLAQIAQHVEATDGKPLPCTLETLAEALKAEGLTFKRNRYSLKKNGAKRHSP